MAMTGEQQARSQTASTAPPSDEIPDALKHFDSLPDSANVRLPIVQAICGYSSATVWRRSKDGTLPRPRRLSPGVTVWNVGELRNALTVRSAT